MLGWALPIWPTAVASNGGLCLRLMTRQVIRAGDASLSWSISKPHVLFSKFITRRVTTSVVVDNLGSSVKTSLERHSVSCQSVTGDMCWSLKLLDLLSLRGMGLLLIFWL